MAPPSTVKLLIKSPTGVPATFQLDVGSDATLADLQARLASEYDGKPAPEQQTLIFAGKVLKDADVTLKQLIEQARSEPFEGPHSFHLVVRKQQQDAVRSAPSAATTSATAPATPPQASSAAPVPSPSPAPTASTSSSAFPAAPAPAAEPAAPDAGASSSAADVPPASAAPAILMQPYMYVNPVYAAAYQAAYQAALAAALQQQPGSSQIPGLGQAGPPAPYVMTGMGYMPAAHMGAMGMQGAAPLQLQFAYNAAMHHPMFAHIQAGPHGPEIRIDGVRQDALGPLAMAVAHLRQRRGGNQAIGAHQHGMHMHARQRRPRGITLRISVRTILQVLVFAMVLYQHFMWHRFIALLVGGLVLYLTSAWGPLRRALANLQQPPPAPGQRQAPPAAGVQPGDAGQQPAAGGHEAAGGGADAAAVGAGPGADGAQPRPRGLVQELLVLLLGFVTSLLPAWNYNPEDAAAFAAAQDIAAREERAQQQQQQQQQGFDGPGGVGAEAGMGNGEAAAEPDVQGGAGIDGQELGQPHDEHA